MNSDWQAFLLAREIVLQESVVQRFNTLAPELLATQNGAVLCDLSQFGTLRVSGADAQSLLQNLLSNDIGEVSINRAQFSSFNSAKGRMLAIMLIWRNGDDYLLQLPRTLAETILKKLSMYVLRAKVKITDASNEIISLGFSGANVQDILREQFGEIPQQQLDLTHIALGSVIKINDTRLQINTTAQLAPVLWEILSRYSQPIGCGYWDWLNIRSGIPMILPQTQEQFVAQMVNFDLIGGVSFKKGCYPGQEIVARMQYLGKLKRRMYLAHLNGSDFPQAGDELFSADMEGQASGMIVNAAPAPAGGYDAPAGGYDMLATIQIASQETQTVHWKSLEGEALHFMPLPYQLPDA